MISVGIELSEQEYKEIPLWKRLLHNIRKHKTNSSIFSQEHNFYILNKDLENIDKINQENAKLFFQSEEDRLIKLVKDKTKQKSKNHNHIVESLISISDDEESKGLKKIDYQNKLNDYIKYLEEIEKVKVYSASFHYDEGHYENKITGLSIQHLDENGKPLKDFKFDSQTMIKKRNIHFHIIHSNINEENGKGLTKSFYKRTEKYNIDNKIQRFIKNEKGKMVSNPKFLKGLSLFQNKIAEIFKMSRGKINSKNKHNRNFKQQVNELNIEINKSQQEIYDLKKQLESKDLKITDLENNIETLKTEKEDLNTTNLQQKELIQSRDEEIQILKTQLSRYKTNQSIITSKDIDSQTKKQIHKINKALKGLIQKLDLENRTTDRRQNNSNTEKERRENETKERREILGIQKNGIKFLIQISKKFDFVLNNDMNLEQNKKILQDLENDMENIQLG